MRIRPAPRRTHCWSPTLEWLRDSLLAAGTISPGDLDLIPVTDDLDELITVIQSCVEYHTPPPA